ncbi:MAG: hypothetical protein AAF564_16895 [Bacteroidota bacterium]
MKVTHSILLVALLSLLSGCKLVDLQTKTLKKEGLQEAKIAEGKALLDKAWQAQGMDKMHAHATYRVVAEDHWKGLLGRLGKVWPDLRTDLQLDYAINTFDSRVKFLNGKKEGTLAGLQSWQYYEQAPGGDIAFLDKADKNIRFGLAAFQYFFELGDRLKRAPIITAITPAEREGQMYDRVFATWNTTKAHVESDQYRVWINRDTGLIDFAEFTVRDTPLKAPGAKAFYGSIHFDDFREINGVLIPFEQFIFINGLKKDRKFLHKLTIADFEFDVVDLATLRPNAQLDLVGDAKTE